MKLYRCRRHGLQYCEDHVPPANYGTCNPHSCADAVLVVVSSDAAVAARCPSCFGRVPPASADDVYAAWAGRPDPPGPLPYASALSTQIDASLANEYFSGVSAKDIRNLGLTPWRDGTWVVDRGLVDRAPQPSDKDQFDPVGWRAGRWVEFSLDEARVRLDHPASEVRYGGARSGGKSAWALSYVSSLLPGSRVLAMTPRGNAEIEVGRREGPVDFVPWELRADPTSPLVAALDAGRMSLSDARARLESIAYDRKNDAPSYLASQLQALREGSLSALTIEARAGDVIRVNGVPLTVRSVDPHPPDVRRQAPYSLGPIPVEGWPEARFVPTGDYAPTLSTSVPGWPDATFTSANQARYRANR